MSKKKKEKIVPDIDKEEISNDDFTQIPNISNLAEALTDFLDSDSLDDDEEQEDIKLMDGDQKPMRFPHIERVAGSADFPSEDVINGSAYPIVRLSMSCAMPGVPASLPQSFDENDPVIQHAVRTGEPVLMLYQDTEKYVKQTSKGLSRVGVLSKIMRCVNDEENPELKMLLSIGGPRVKVNRFITRNGECKAVVRCKEWLISKSTEPVEMAAYIHELTDTYDKVQALEGSQGPRAAEMLGMLEERTFVSTLLFSLSVSPKIKNEILCCEYIENVIKEMLIHLNNLVQLLEIRNRINREVNHQLNDMQKENFIQHQIDLLQKEIGNGATEDWERFEQRAKDKIWNEDTQKAFDREIAKLKRFNPNSPDYSIQYSYIDTFLSLPWQKTRVTETTLDDIEDTLNRDHFGLERVKERILEHMAVAQLRQDNKSPIICLVGPPGVGKTSLGKSIASAMGREYGRVAFGGLHDEAEIRGHRRTYIGAMPGRIVAALLKTEYSNPVIVLDEIDKIGKDYKGDPSTALLEVLDPEQNSHFHDNYLDVDYDLSHILFIATANSLETVSGPLRDRMEIISIPGYITAEKMEIAKRHLLPKQLEANGLKGEKIEFTEDGLVYLIDYYTRESGVRRLEKVIGKVLRKIAVKKIRKEEYPTLIDAATIKSLIGKEEFNPEMYENNDSIGVVTGLAWTQVGGEILFIESSITEGKGKLTLTGNLGDVMKESATLALQYLKSHADKIGLEQKAFDDKDVHIHVPEGAIPKDGPSAGITMATSLASSFTGKKVRPNLAMTGEITLRGKVLPVGGIREKIIAAKRAGIKEIILSKENRKDIEEVKAEYVEGVTFTFVENVSEVLERALLN